MFGFTVISKKRLRRMVRDAERNDLIFRWASNERTYADRLLSKIMLVSDSVEVSETAQEISKILRGELRPPMMF